MPALTAAILVGGLGTRLKSVVADRPKPMAEVHGRPFLTYLLDQLVTAGPEKVVLCTGYRAEYVQASLGTQYRSLGLNFSQETEPLGTAGALRLALPALNSETVLVMNGDSICECDLDAFWVWHRKQQAVLSLLLTQVDDVFRYGQVKVDEAGKVTRFVEKDTSNSEPGWINAGIYFLPRTLIAELPRGQAISLEREVFPDWIGRGLSGYRGGKRFLDIGTPESYQLASQLLPWQANE